MRLLNQLRELTRDQDELAGLALAGRGLLRDHQQEALNDLMARRQIVFRRVMSRHRRLQPVWRDWEAVLAGLDPAEAAEAQSLLEKLRVLSERLNSLDRESVRLLEREMAEMRQELGRLETGRQLFSAYRPAPLAGRGPDKLSRTA
ncbi:MAG: flagellar protein FliT [Desulfarculus sp.]|nr:flagellar protein FliT [Desulfarculus sp.]